MKDYLQSINHKSSSVIKVTMKDIQTSEKRSCFDCAIANAIMRKEKISYQNH